MVAAVLLSLSAVLLVYLIARLAAEAAVQENQRRATVRRRLEAA